jgi:hypothetical protein
MPAAGAPVATDRDEQRRGTPPERLMRLPPGHRVPRRALAPAATTPTVRVVCLDHPAREDGALWFEALPHDFEAELIEACERGQVGTGKARVAGSVRAR